jgi:hypothetical protein
MALLRHFNLKYALLLITLSLAACQSPAVKEKKYPYLIKVQIKGCEGGKADLFAPQTRGIGLLDSAKLERGQFVFRGMIAHPGVYHVSCLCQNSKAFNNAEVYLPADSVQIVVTPGANLIPDIYQPAGAGAYEYIGSYLRNTTMFSTARQQREIASFLRTRDSLWNKFFIDRNRLKAKMNAAIGTGNKLEIDRWADSTRRVQENFPDYMARAAEQFIKRHPHSEAALFALLDAGDLPAARQRLPPYYQTLPDSVKASYFGQIAGKRFGVSADARK